MSVHRLHRDRHGNVPWPTEPIQSFTGRVRQAAGIVAERRRAEAPRTWTVTVACKNHRRSLTIEAPTKPKACMLAIDTYRAETKMPSSTSVLVTECVPATDPQGPKEAA